MIPFFDYLRQKARDAVLAGVQDALDQIDPPGRDALPPGPSPATPDTPPTPPPPPLPAAGSLQDRLARATGQLTPEPEPGDPTKPSSPKRGRGGAEGGSQPRPKDGPK